MEDEFQEQLKGLEGSFMTERNLMITNHDKQKKVVTNTFILNAFVRHLNKSIQFDLKNQMHYVECRN